MTAKILQTALIALLFLGAGKALSWMYADILVQHAEAAMDSWYEPDLIVTEAMWEQAQGQISQAIQLNKSNAAYHHLSGMLYEWREFLNDAPVTAEVVTESRQLALKAYQEEVRQRPAWPDGWLAIANVKGLMSELDAEFVNAIEKTIALGPNESEVNIKLTELSVSIWPQLMQNPKLQLALMQAALRGLHARQFINSYPEILKNTTFFAALCATNRQEITDIRPSLAKACPF